ncbi:MAG: undecaprenyl-diphosphate phosphatase [Acidobacteriota bacterium]
MILADPVLQSVLLGILQGLTEFLPISSSAHLLLLPWLLGWKPMGLVFDVLLHGGTLLALLIYFRSQVKTLARQSVGRFTRRNARVENGPDLSLPILVGTAPLILVGGLFHGLIEKNLRQPALTMMTLCLFGILLWWADRRGSRNRLLARIRPFDGFIIGLSQSLALMPGVSRSGITITAALFLGFSRVDSARFSFLLAIPAIALATLAELFELIQTGPGANATLLTFVLGIVFSFGSGLLCLKYLLRFLESRSFSPFAAYRVLLSAFAFWWLLR